MAIRPLVIQEGKITRRDTESIKKYLQEVDNMPTLTVDEEYELAMKAMEGDEEARKALVEGNLRFVISVAKQYEGINGAKLPDLINEGNYGMTKASYMYDPTQGFKFISYSVWWIRRSIMEFITKNTRTIRIPSNKATNIKQLTELVNSLEQQLERKATMDEIMEFIIEMGEDFTEGDVEFFMSFDTTNTLSLDKPFGDESESDLKDTLPSTSFAPTDHIISKADTDYNINAMLDLLPKQAQKTVLIRLFGLHNGQPQNLEEVADHLNISRERVRQIRDKALKILKYHVRDKDLNYMIEK